jgi:hypothetical protein
VYYYESNTEGYSFLYQKEIRDSLQNNLGYFFVVAKPKKYTAEALYFELFKQGKDNPLEAELNYAYAIYNKGTIITNFGDYNFPSRITKQLYPGRIISKKRMGRTANFGITEVIINW